MTKGYKKDGTHWKQGKSLDKRKEELLSEKEEKVNLGGRPSKLTMDFIDVAEEVLNEDMNVIIHTDADLLDEINDRLIEYGRPDECVCKSTFENWKNANKNAKIPEDDLGKRFLTLIKKALRIQRKNLFNQLMDEDKNQWVRYAWVIERKFSEWNLRIKQDVHQSGTVISKIEFVDVPDSEDPVSAESNDRDEEATT